ncbi:hypothetical protein ES703_32299 [subsurface metagenome]
MHTTIAYSALLAEHLAQWWTVPAVPDPHIKTEGNYIYMGIMNKIIGYFSLPGTTATMVRLTSPSIRRINPYHIVPFETAIIPAADVFRAFWPDIALELEPTEGLECEQYISAAEVVGHIIFLAETIPEPIRGNIHTIRFTCEPDPNVGTWAFSEITLIDDLPVGSYNIVGARLVLATGIAFRFVPVGGTHRPGGVCSTGIEVEEPKLQRHGGLGVWCSFDHGLEPGIEVLTNNDAAKATLTGYMDIIPV